MSFGDEVETHLHVHIRLKADFVSPPSGRTAEALTIHVRMLSMSLRELIHNALSVRVALLCLKTD